MSSKCHGFASHLTEADVALLRWWKAKIKPGEDVEDADKVGLVPSNYVEEVCLSVL